MITCGNRKAHDGTVGYHYTINETKECYGLITTCAWEVDTGRYDEDGAAVIRRCSGVVTENPRGWTCSNGHEHVTAEVRYAEGWDYAHDEDEAKSLRRNGVNAVSMSGGGI